MQETRPDISLIIPVYNRPAEVEELLASVAAADHQGVEVIIVEDGSSQTSEEVARRWGQQIDLTYHFKTNSGPGPSRNVGASLARGQWLVFLDSDTTLPPTYLPALRGFLAQAPPCCFGGPDREAGDFTPVQKAISYSMTSLLTTGGIRGSKKGADTFYPRSFNLGIRASIFLQLEGFAPMRFGEDLDLSMRVKEAHYPLRYVPEAWLYHKRRTDFRKFFKQIYNSGIARIHLNVRHPGTLKLVHMLPAGFVLFGAFSILMILFGIWWPMAIMLFYLLAVAVHAAVHFKSLKLGIISMQAAAVQHTAYGTGFLHAFWKVHVLRQGEFEAFGKSFYK